MGKRQVPQTFTFFVRLASRTGYLPHLLKVRYCLIIFGQKHPHRAAPLIHRQKLFRIQYRGNPCTHLEGACIKRNGILVSVVLARFISGFDQIQESPLPGFALREVVCELGIALRQALLVERFHSTPNSPVQFSTPPP